MKRSEVLSLINNQFELLLIEIANGSDLHTIDTKDYAINLLAKLESIGMLPPAALIPIPKNELPLVPGDFKNSLGVWCTPKNQWEEENEA